MDEKQAKELGEYIQNQRQQSGLSSRSLARAVGVDQAQIVRLEAGQVSSPRAEVLGQIASVLGVSLADMYALAGYPTPKGLPNLRPYLRTKYSGLSPAALDEIEAVIRRETGDDITAGPTNGEDEN